MGVKYFDQDEITQLLNDRLNISITKGTFTRYNQLGFILMPQKRAGVSVSSRRVIYHPLVPAELATAFLLFKGDWLSPDSDERVARATIQDVFLGRLFFYRNFFNTDPYDLKLIFADTVADFSTSIRAFIPDSTSFADTIAMNPDNVNNCLDFYMTNILKAFLDTGIRNSYLQYIEDTYSITLMQMVDVILQPGHKLDPLKRIVPPDIKSHDNRPF